MGDCEIVRWAVSAGHSLDASFAYVHAPNFWRRRQPLAWETEPVVTAGSHRVQWEGEKPDLE